MKTIFQPSLSLLLFFTLILCSPTQAQYTVEDIHAYIDTYKETAIAKMIEHKIPASITLAQGIFESACGKSKLATEANNHFGIKCHKDWMGDTIHIDDDELQECFRKYEKVEDSYNDHSLFLTRRTRYQALFKLNLLDYAAWARGLKAAGYATNPQYAERLINLIETYNIAYQDTIAMIRMGKLSPSLEKNSEPETIANTDNKEITNQPKEIPQETIVSQPTSPKGPIEEKVVAKKEEPKIQPTESKEKSTQVFTATPTDFPQGDCPWTNRTVYENNRTQFVIATAHDTYKSIAADVQRSVNEILSYNEAFPNSTLTAGQVVYIEPKNRKLMKTHIVQKGETLRYISQKYAIQLKMIYHYNGLSEESVIQPDDKIIMSNF
ncbi:MAG: glucosaminidase domain-containing protein [Bacteroidales bacterium]|nr:glucosaminidase domain-containing protein [Bacteroidales bacterium]